MTDSAEARFRGRADAYAVGRPGYPAGVVAALLRCRVLRPGALVADLGTGTGLLAECFVQAGFQTYGVEPNPEMLDFARARLADDPRFEARAGSAEATGLPDQSVDVAVAGQAFHWFDPHRLRGELLRILKSPGGVAWIWNTRHPSGTAFLEAYESFLLRWGTDYAQVKARYADLEAMARVSGRPAPASIDIPNVQALDQRGLLARLRSCSYLPSSKDPVYADMIEDAHALFTAHARRGRVELVYTTQVYAVANVRRT